MASTTDPAASKEEQEEHDNNDDNDSSLLDSLDPNDRQSLTQALEAFVVQHASFHRPLALVSSGGTVADLEVHSVRCLDNFSTGLRGAVSVEGLLRRGYAVIHLWRVGSAAPFARVVAQQLGLAPHAALDVRSVGRLFAENPGGGGGENGKNDYDYEDDVQRVTQAQDPWLQEMPSSSSSLPNGAIRKDASFVVDPLSSSISSSNIRLARGLGHSTALQKALRERQTALREHRLLTIPFRSVEEYLAKLQLSAQALRCCHSLALTYLAAAVSDFYVPRSQRSEHKIQSREQHNSSGKGGLVLELQPVPKTLGLLRSEWAPSAFCVSFKLETDLAILRSKAERAVQAYGVHMVVCNILETRHSKVWILAPETQRFKLPAGAQDWNFDELSVQQPSSSSSTSTDELEEMILDKVVEAHFEYLSWHIQKAEGVDAARQAQEALKEKRRRVQQQFFWKRASSIGTEIAGYLLSGLLSWAIATAIQRVRTSSSGSIGRK